jgi:hypothetical protein
VRPRRLTGKEIRNIKKIIEEKYGL